MHTKNSRRREMHMRQAADRLVLSARKRNWKPSIGFVSDKPLGNVKIEARPVGVVGKRIGVVHVGVLFQQEILKSLRRLWGDAYPYYKARMFRNKEPLATAKASDVTT